MIPTVDNSHVDEGQALITSHYAKLVVVPGIIKALMLRFQQIEDAYWSLLNGFQLASHPMGGGPWSILDQIGAIVGIARNGLTDVDYLAAIRLKIRINRSRGLAEDIIQIAALVVTGAVYNEWFPAAWEVGAYNTTASVAAALVKYLGEAKSAGTAGQIRYALVPLSSLFVPGSNVGTVPTATGLEDSVSGMFPNSLASLANVSKL